MPSIDLSRAAIVVAHPDDEVLWFGSLVPRVGRIVICYGMQAAGTLRDGRRRVVEAYPYRTIDFYDLVQPGSLAKATWPEPRLGPMGMVLAQRSASHETSFCDIVRRLRRSLVGSATVFTHNPWGEYGHEEHSLVYAAVKTVQCELGFELYVSPYVGCAVLGLFRQVIDDGINGVARFAVDRRSVSEVADLYRRHGVWTWNETWDWAEEESFLRLGPEGRIRARAVPFEFIDAPPH